MFLYIVLRAQDIQVKLQAGETIPSDCTIVSSGHFTTGPTKSILNWRHRELFEKVQLHFQKQSM